jgi:hypothetical protein
MQQTCGQRLDMAAGSKRRALAFYVSVQICQMFPTSKCRREWAWDLGLCMTLGLAKRLPLHSGKFRRILCQTHFQVKSPNPGDTPLSFFLSWSSRALAVEYYKVNVAFRWGLILLERTRVLSGMQFTRHFIAFVVVETKQFASSNVNVILMRQTYGQRSSMSTGSKRRALAFYLGVRIFPVFPISKGREESDLSLCTASVLANRMPPCIRKLRQFLRPNTFINRKSPTHIVILFASTEVEHRPGSNYPLHFHIGNM